LKIVTPALWSEWAVWEHESIKSSNTYIFTDDAPKAVGDKYDRTVALNIVSSKSGNGSFGIQRFVTLLSASLRVASPASKFFAWSPILLLEILDRQPMTVASYPKLSIRASGIFGGSNVSGQGLTPFPADQVWSRWPVTPCTKTMLEYGKEGKD
jgi:hypothetical protein